MSTILVDMEELLMNLGFNAKEARVYLALLEFGNQPASVLARKLSMPKATVLFILEKLVCRNVVRKTHRGRTLYFFAEPSDLQEAFDKKMKKQSDALNKVMPLLEETKNPFTSPPKLTVFEGLDGCRKAYSMLLESSTDVREFGTHDDLEKMGKDFMMNFIEERAGRKIFLKDICVDSPTHRRFKKFDKIHCRDQKFFDGAIGKLYSSISVFEDKVVILNLYHDAFALVIQNHEIAETLKTIHKLTRGEK